MKSNVAWCFLSVFQLLFRHSKAFVGLGTFASRFLSQKTLVPRVLRQTHSIQKGKRKAEVGEDNETGFQFQGWVDEEIEIQKEERRQKIKEIEDDGEYVPAYLRDLYDQFDTVAQEDVLASALPIIAVIGRPNTGKSTIVNRLTESFKVGFTFVYFMWYCISMHTFN